MTKQVHHFNDMDQAVVSLQLDTGRFWAITEDRQYSGFGATMLEAIADLGANIRAGE